MKKLFYYVLIAFIFFTVLGEDICVPAKSERLQAPCVETNINCNVKMDKLPIIFFYPKPPTTEYFEHDITLVKERPEINIKTENKKEAYYDFGDNNADGVFI